LSIAAASQYFDIVAVAEKETDLAQQTARQYGCAAFDDYRQLLTQNDLDCLLVAAAMHGCHQHLRSAIKKRFNIFKRTPLARNFEEASELVRLAHAEHAKIAVAVPLRFSEGLRHLRSVIDNGPIEQISLVTVCCDYRTEHLSPWHLDPALAGGGVLLHESYQIIDSLLRTFGLPEQVYSLLTNTAADRLQRHALTEDCAAVAMRFASDLCLNLVATRAAGPHAITESISCLSKDMLLVLGADKMTIQDRAGRKLKQKRFSYDDGAATKQALEQFALSILDPQQNPLACSAKEQLQTMAVIEAAYLSSRTGMPEQPRRILALEQTEPTLFWPPVR